MKNSKLNIHYMYLIPLLLIQVFTTIFMVTIMNVKDYGVYTLYQTTINFLYIITAGVPDGYILKNRSKTKGEIGGIARLLYTYLATMLISFVIGTIVINVINLDEMYVYAMCAASIMGIYQLTQSIFRNLNEAHKQNIYLIASRLIFVADGFYYLASGDIKQMFGFDLVLRTFFVTIAFIHVLIDYRKNDKVGDSYKNYARVGLLIMISNTVFNMTMMVDKYALAKDLESLGLYSVAITIVIMIRVIITPLNQVLFVTLDEHQDINAYTKKLVLFIISCFILMVPAIFIGKYLIINIAIFNKYIDAIGVIAITMLMIPLMVPLESLVVNLGKLKNSRSFFIKSIIIACLYIIVLFGYTSTLGASLPVYALLVVACYFASFIIYSFDIFSKQQMQIIYSLYSILLVIYLIIINLFIV